jgi:ATP-dependent helicase/nuclease subunit A
MSDVPRRVAGRKAAKPDSGQMSLLPASPARRNRVVEAGAGTGKTTSIVKSVVELLLDNPTLATERIVLVTFTEKAAGEIADRIRHALVELDTALAQPGEAQWPATGAPIIRIAPERRDAAREAVASHLQRIDLLRSQTIHSFCQSILRLYPIEAGLDPQFALIQGFEQMRLYDRIYRDWFDSETRGAGRAEWVEQWATAFAHLNTLANVRARIFSLANRRDLIESRGLSLGDAGDFERSVVPLLETIRAIPSAEVESIAEPTRAAVDAIRAVPPLAGGTLREWLSWFEPIEKPLTRVTFRNKRGLSEDAAAALGALRGAAGCALVVDRLRKHRAASALLELTRRFIEFRDREKDRRGVVDFDDLLFRVQRLLDDPEVLRALRRRYEYIFVDEFQDTDRVQADIIGRLARDASGSFVDGKTVLVGDAKQSIYGFRRADPETYAATVDDFIAGGATREILDVQFRSEAQLVDGLNVLFSRLFDHEGTRSVARPAYKELEAGKPKGEDRDARFTFLHVACDEDEDPHVAEARAIAAWIRSRDPEGIDLRRFALLFRARTHWQKYLDTFDRCGLPYVVQPIAAFLQTPAAVDLLTVLRAAALPFDEAAFVSAARSPYFGLSDDEIVRDKLGITDGALLRTVRERLASWAKFGERGGAAAAVDAAVDESGMELVYRTLRASESAQALAQIARFRRMAVDWDLAAGGSLRQFVEEIARRKAEGDDKEPPLVDDAQNAVRILTAHGAKGLEFDTVILPAMSGGGGGNQLDVFAVESGEPTLVMKGEQLESLSAWCRTADGVTLAEIGNQRDAAEDDRLFYVAVTRAITEVVFACNPSKLKASGFWKSLNAILGIEKESLEVKAPALPGRVVEEIPIGGNSLGFAFERVAPADLAAAPERFATPAVASLLDRPYAAELEREPAQFQQLSRADALREVAAEASRSAGILLHRVFEIWDLEPATLARAIDAAAAELGTGSADVARVRRRLGRLAPSATLARVRTAQCAWRELSIYVPGPGGAPVERRIDRLAAENRGYLVVDYKSGAPAAERTEKDRAQVEAYCEAVAAMSGTQCRGLLWYIDDDADRAIDV